ncbi:efflux RND transporter periplasmic adaptor subunit [Scopulibacillus darangshiensis]|uniref:efflux RND transporter periplasmic adaptor subunit n=1 Tax=Scopulibacillus darangshiensis TaxID=442528 RepID=UPI001404C5C1|nr:efflux RND transporter periplasmic adaptor subunit [Scopulibacillus darangshiensis]
MGYKKVFSLLITSLILIAVISGCSNETSTTPVKTTTQKVKKGNLEVGLAADGRINLSLTNLNFEEAGVVKKINVKVGEKVKKGEVLAELDDTDVQLAITKAENTLNKAEANYTDAVNKHEINRMEAKNKLDEAKTKMDARPDDDSLKASYELALKKYNLTNSDSSIQSAKLSIEEAKNDLQETKNNLSKLNLKAPFTGKIMNIAYKVGESVSGTKSTSTTGASTNTATSGSSFMTMYDPSVVYITANVTESDIPGIKKDQDMRVTIDSLSLENLKGKVVSVSEEPNIDSSGIVTYEVTGKLTKTNENIKDGMTAFLTFLKKEKKDVLLVPNKAIFVENGKQYVNVKDPDAKTEKRAITGGLTNGIQTEVVKGLKEGETVVIGGVKK